MKRLNYWPQLVKLCLLGPPRLPKKNLGSVGQPPLWGPGAGGRFSIAKRNTYFSTFWADFLCVWIFFHIIHNKEGQNWKREKNFFLKHPTVSTITHIGICSRDAYHCQCHRHVQEGSISQHYSNFSGIQYFQDIDTILMIADHPAFTKKNAGNSRH